MSAGGVVGGVAGAPLPSPSGQPEAEWEKYARMEAEERRARSRAVLLDLLAHPVADRALLFPAVVGMLGKEDMLLFLQSLIDPRKFPAAHGKVGAARLALADADHATGVPSPTGLPRLALAAGGAVGLSLSVLAGALLASAPLPVWIKAAVSGMPLLAAVAVVAVGHALAQRR